MSLTTSEILTRLRTRTRCIEPVTLPGLELELGLVVLTQAEHQAAVFGTDALFRARAVEPRTLLVDAWNCELATQILARAVVLPHPDDQGKPVPVFKSAETLRESLTPGEQAHLLDTYYAHPDYEVRQQVTAEKLRELANEVRKSPLASSGLDSATLRQLVTFLVAQPSS